MCPLLCLSIVCVQAEVAKNPDLPAVSPVVQAPAEKTVAQMLASTKTEAQEVDKQAADQKKKTDAAKAVPAPCTTM